MTTKIREVVNVHYFDDAPFDVWREKMAEFEETHTDCYLGMEPGNYCYGQSDPDYLAFTGYRNPTEEELAAEYAIALEKDRQLKIAEAKKAKEKESRELKALERARLQADPDYPYYRELQKKFGKLEYL